MPNTSPPVTSVPALRSAREALLAEARCDVGQYLGATEANADAVAEGAAVACGLKIYVNDTFGQLRVERLAPLARHFARWPANRPLVVHAEGPMVAAAVGLAAAHGRPVHIAHVSRRSEIELVRAAKEAGLAVTCEVTPHHLLLDEADARALGGFGEVRPALASADDRAALWDSLDVVDCIASDHAPHTRAEKASDEPPPGFPGLETTLPLLLTAVAEGRLQLDRLVELLSAAPARIFGVATPGESAVEVNLSAAWSLPDAGYLTKADWSPFAGRPVRGRVTRTSLRGDVAYDGERVTAPPGLARWLGRTTTRPTPEGAIE